MAHDLTAVASSSIRTYPHIVIPVGVEEPILTPPGSAESIGIPVPGPLAATPVPPAPERLSSCRTNCGSLAALNVLLESLQAALSPGPVRSNIPRPELIGKGIFPVYLMLVQLWKF